MAKVIYREHHWAPNIVGALYVDGIDYEGIEFIYDDISFVYKSIKKK